MLSASVVKGLIVVLQKQFCIVRECREIWKTDDKGPAVTWGISAFVNHCVKKNHNHCAAVKFRRILQCHWCAQWNKTEFWIFEHNSGGRGRALQILIEYHNELKPSVHVLLHQMAQIDKGVLQITLHYCTSRFFFIRISRTNREILRDLNAYLKSFDVYLFKPN